MFIKYDKQYIYTPFRWRNDPLNRLYFSISSTLHRVSGETLYAKKENGDFAKKVEGKGREGRSMHTNPQNMLPTTITTLTTLIVTPRVGGRA